MPIERYAVVGGGIVGLATARELIRWRPDSTVVVLEKEAGPGRHQTGHNSGVVHAGLYYPPGSLKARLCIRGRHLLREFCHERGLAYQECGKVVVAGAADEIPALRSIEARARANGVPELAWVGPERLGELEPHARGVAALHSPHTAIVNYLEVAEALAGEVDLRAGFEVTSVEANGSEIVFHSPAGEVVADRAVICAGLQADRVGRLAGDRDGPAIIPFRGEYWRLVPHRCFLVKGLIYPVPDPLYPFLGVHFTRRIGGAVDLGPNAVLALARQGYRRRDVVPADIRAVFGDPGFRALARRHWRAGLGEMWGSLSKRAFVRQAARLVPGVTPADVVRAPAGVRAQAVDADGTLVDDFRIHRSGPQGRIAVVRNAPSPAATSSLAIAEHIVEQILS